MEEPSLSEALRRFCETWLGVVDAIVPAYVGVNYIAQASASLPTNQFGDVIEGVVPIKSLTTAEGRRMYEEIYGVRERKMERDVERQALAEVRAEREAARLETEKARITAALNALGDDVYMEHDVLRFTKSFHSTMLGKDNPVDREFTYAAIKAGGKWYLTGRVGERNLNGMTWDEFTLWLVSGTAVTELTPMVPR